MSYILEALKKSESERADYPSSTLIESHNIPENTKTDHQIRLLFGSLTAMAAVVFLGYTATFFMDQGKEKMVMAAEHQIKSSEQAVATDIQIPQMKMSHVPVISKIESNSKINNVVDEPKPVNQLKPKIIAMSDRLKKDNSVKVPQKKEKIVETKIVLNQVPQPIISNPKQKSVVHVASNTPKAMPNHREVKVLTLTQPLNDVAIKIKQSSPKTRTKKLDDNPVEKVTKLIISKPKTLQSKKTEPVLAQHDRVAVLSVETQTVEKPQNDQLAILNTTIIKAKLHPISGVKPIAEEIQKWPLLKEKPLAFRKALPALNMNIHMYDEKSEKRFAMINMKKYEKGDLIDERVLVNDILPDGLVLVFQDQPFFIKR